MGKGRHSTCCCDPRDSFFKGRLIPGDIASAGLAQILIESVLDGSCIFFFDQNRGKMRASGQLFSPLCKLFQADIYPCSLELADELPIAEMPSGLQVANPGAERISRHGFDEVAQKMNRQAFEPGGEFYATDEFKSDVLYSRSLVIAFKRIVVCNRKCLEPHGVGQPQKFDRGKRTVGFGRMTMKVNHGLSGILLA